MVLSIGLDIGGSKIAGALYDAAERQLAQVTLPTPGGYRELLRTCTVIVEQLEQNKGPVEKLGVCAPYANDSVSANIPSLIGQNLKQDLENILARQVLLGNDANCAALAEALEGSGKGYYSVFGLIMGTGIGGGFILGGQIFTGANNICGEIGHLPLPYYEARDGERVACGCGQVGCIEKLLAGSALTRLYQSMTGAEANTKQIAEQALQGHGDAERVLDRYYTVVAKAMVTILHSFDPDVITVSGGLNSLPGLYDEVPKRWGRYCLCKIPKTKFVPATFGAMAGLRGAALLARKD